MYFPHGVESLELPTSNDCAHLSLRKKSVYTSKLGLCVNVSIYVTIHQEVNLTILRDSPTSFFS
jgi:hypothetical protein